MRHSTSILQGPLLVAGLCAIGLVAGCSSRGENPAPSVVAPVGEMARTAAPLSPGRGETDYAGYVAIGEYRSAPAERSANFVPVGDLGLYGLCIRRAGAAGTDPTLIVWQRPLTDGPIAQSEEDAMVLPQSAPGDICRTAVTEWVAL